MEIQLPRWSRLHANLAPFGIALTTYLLTYFDIIGWRVWEFWKIRDHLAALSDMVDLGILVYIVVALAIDRGISMIFYALEQREKRRKQRELREKRMIEEAIKDGLARGKVQGMDQGIDLVFATLERDPDASIEDVRRAVEAARKEAD